MVKLFSKNSNLCDHNPLMLRQTDGQTDRQTTCDRKTALCTLVHPAVKSSQVYLSSSRIKYTAKLHNTKLYSEIYTQQNYTIK